MRGNPIWPYIIKHTGITCRLLTYNYFLVVLLCVVLLAMYLRKGVRVYTMNVIDYTYTHVSSPGDAHSTISYIMVT